MKTLYKKIIGLEADDAKKLLDKKGIDYETTSKLTFKEKTGYIVDIKENESGSLVLYESNRKMLIFIIILASLIVGLTATFGNGIYESIKEQIIEIGGIGKPELSVEEGWGQERTVNVIKDAKSHKKIMYYEYCLRETTEAKCNWKRTDTKNVVLGETGHWYVTFRAVDEEGRKGKEATIEAYVDNTVPVIESFKVIEKTINSIKVKTATKDLHSGIDKIMYSIDGRTYVDGSEEYIFTNLQPGVTYRLYVKVYDKAENGTIVSILVRTELTEEQKQALTEEELKKLEEETDEEKEDKWDIPKINLDKLPSVFTEKEEYDLPSFYDFGNDTGEVVCLVDGIEAKDTSLLTVGRHTVKCTATSKHDKIAEVEKEILVQAEEGEDEVKDGWIKLNLYYPEESYNWQWRYGLTDNDIDEEFEELGWQDYTGPILIKIEDIPRIYIRYDMNGKTVIVPPTGVAHVEIMFEENPVKCGESTTVEIDYDADALTKQYRINGGKWQNYVGPFDVNGNTQIEARVTKNEDVYNTDGEKEYTKLITGRDVKTLKEKGCSIGTSGGPTDVAINLNGISNEVYLGENRSLPSYYTYGIHGEGTVECLDQDGNRVTNAKYLSVGTYTVTCNLEAADGTTAGPVKKKFKIIEHEYDPYIELSDIPKKIVLGDSYNIPSNYSYGTHGTGTFTCEDGYGNQITNTNQLALGTYTIGCLLTAADGTTATATKTIAVKEGFEPYVDLDNIPNNIHIGDFYRLPSHYGYGRPNIGTLTCTIDGTAMWDTHSLGLGRHELECNIVNSVGLTDRASKTINVIKWPKNPGDSQSLTGPRIIADPGNSVKTEGPVSVTIAPQEAASRIYYRINGGSWQQYTTVLSITKNVVIEAYYIRASDGKVSTTSTYYVKNIKAPNKPYVEIDANPSYFSPTVNSVEVTITGIDCDYIEYSFDNVIFTRYTGSFNVTNSVTVYARGVNQNGVGPTESLTITTKNPPVIPINLDIAIAANPDGTQSYLINETEVTINYDSRAENKYYKIGANDTWHNYTGPFTVNQNETIYAYATSANGQGNAQLMIDYLTLGIADPIITGTPASPTRAHKVTIHIDWDGLTNTTATASAVAGSNQVSRKYKVVNDDGTDTGWLDWAGDFVVEGNCTIYAYQEDVLGNRSNTVQYSVNNVVPAPVFTSVNLGDYYLIRLNYPSMSDSSAREYKWKDNGTWKPYDEHGILLIKQEEVHKYNLNATGVEIEDENGNKIRIDMTHVYVLDLPLSELSENLFMRWDNTKPDAPTINFNTTDPATEVEVSITYPKVLMDKYYKIAYTDGTDTGWLEYTGPFKIDKNNTTIYAYGNNRIEISSDIVNRTITNIDENDPVIQVLGDFETPTRKLTLTVNATDDKMLYMVKWAEGKKTKDYFNEGKEDLGTTLLPGATVQVENNGWYTFYAVDQAGNEVIKEVEVTNIDKTAPEITITVLTQGVKTSAQVSIDFGDSQTKQYSIGGNSNYHNYEGTLTLSSYDYYELANPDGSLTLYAKGTDTAGNTQEVFEYLRCLDLDKPQEPTINLHMDYPTLTADGFTTDNYVEVTYANRDDIINEISLDNGTTWTAYTGRKVITDQTKVMARSKKTQTGFTSSSEKTVNQAENALLETAYDDNNTSEQTVAYSKKATFYVNINGAIKITIKTNATSGSQIKTYVGDTLDKTVNIESGAQDITLTSGTTKVEIIPGTSGLKIAEIVANGVVASVKGDSILSILQNNDLSAGYYTFGINGKSESYSVHLVDVDTDTISTTTCYGDSGDVGTNDSNAENMVIARRKGNLTVNGTSSATATLGPCYDEQYGGPKGFLLYVTGKLTIGQYGIVDNSHGAKAVGDDVYLWKNANGTYEYVPAIGGAGGASSTGTGESGKAGTDESISLTTTARRATGGGGAGSSYNEYGTKNSGSGSAGTSYSGGSGGGGNNDKTTADKLNAQAYGGTGGSALNRASGGAGNPGGSGNLNGVKGEDGTGGLLIIYANSYINNGKITAEGKKGGAQQVAGGSSGGGSINIFTNQPTGINSLGVIIDTKYQQILGDSSAAGGAAVIGTRNYGGAGGTGTVNIGEIRNGTYYDLKTVIAQDIEAYEATVIKTGDSILQILQNNPNLSTGYYTFKIAGKTETYSVHLIEETSATISSSKTYGATTDYSDGTNYAQNMVIVKRNGDLTINGTSSAIATVGPKYGNKGGPKGFLLYVTGTLTIGQYGIIDNSHGAYAEGDDVYLWKNANGTYEYVPAIGGAGGAASKGAGESGKAGTDESISLTTTARRATGGGGAGSSYNEYGTKNSGSGSAGTSYSGGSGGGGNNDKTTADKLNAQAYGGTGGSALNRASGGAGNPGGSGNLNGVKGEDGTGGLLIIYANSYINNGKITAEGKKGGAQQVAGGSSGGGSINIFYNTKSGSGTVSVAGGEKATGNRSPGGAGGTGTITYMQIGSLSASHTLTHEELRTVENTLFADAIGDTITPDIEAPVITVEDKDNSKLVTIKGEDVLRIEYSLDLGDTWTEYTDAIEVTENTVVFARTIDGDGKVLKASTYTITTIEEKEETQEESTEVLPPEVTPEVVEEKVVEEEKPEEGDVNE